MELTRAEGGEPMAGSDQSARERRPWEHRDAWGKLGPNYGRSTRDEFWDAAHVLAPGEIETTLCGASVVDVAQAYSLDSGYKPDDFAGCWTCLGAANRWADPDAFDEKQP